MAFFPYLDWGVLLLGKKKAAELIQRLNSTLSDSINTQSKIVIPAGIHVRLSCLTPFGLMQICSRQICAGIQAPWMDLSLPSMALDTRSRRV